MTGSKAREIILRLFSGMGEAHEVKKYLKRFSQLESSKFAIVKVGGSILRDEMEGLATSLAFLHSVGLTPIVVHGAGPQIDQALVGTGFGEKRRNGLRVTEEGAIGHVLKAFQDENQKLVKALQLAGATAISLTGIIKADFLDKENLGFVGDIKDIELGPIQAALKTGCIPVIMPVGVTQNGQQLNINGDTVANQLIRSLVPFKIIFLTGTGGVLDGNGDLIPVINLATDFENLNNQDWLSSGMKFKINEISDLLRGLPLSSSVSITKPGELTRELFTDAGSGTLVRKGENLNVYESWNDIDVSKVRSLIEASFGEKLDKDYFEKTKLYKAYITETYRALAIVTNETGIPSLDKFVVDVEARGEGLARTLWLKLVGDNPSLFWRARPHNPINGFYMEEADGFIKAENWKIYWRGINDMSRIKKCVSYLQNLPRSVL